MSRHFAVGTSQGVEPGPIATAVAEATVRLLASRDRDGLWGGPDSLDRLISTCHAAMTLLSVGVRAESEALSRALTWLANLDIQRTTTFYWRSGPLLNVVGFDHIVRHDIEHIWKHKGRAGGNPSYPAPFFLLKLIRFYEGDDDLAIRAEDVVQWALEEWDDNEAWYGRTSITSMGLALVADLPNFPRAVINRGVEFLVASYGPQSDGRRGFTNNVIDDAFTVYNLYERWSELRDILPESLWRVASEAAEDLLPQLEHIAATPPPFGGSVDSLTYARAVLARAVMARAVAAESAFDVELSVALINVNTRRVLAQLEGLVRMEPFWGQQDVGDDGYCFVLMPFSPSRRTEIYEAHIKRPLERKLGIECRRADDIFNPTPIMNDIWHSINRAKFVIADLSDRNPNVFYELGLAHVIGKPVILVVENHDDVPFDLKHVRTIIYGDSPKSWQALERNIVKYARPYVEAVP